MTATRFERCCRQYQVEAQHTAKRSAMLRDVLARRQERDGGREHVGTCCHQCREGRAPNHVARELGAVRLQDEHPPIAHIVGRDRYLLAHDLMEARHPVHLLCHRLRLVTDALLRAGEPFSRGKMGCYVEDWWTLDAHVVDLPDDIADAIVERHHTTPSAPSLPLFPPVMPSKLRCRINWHRRDVG